LRAVEPIVGVDRPGCDNGLSFVTSGAIETTGRQLNFFARRQNLESAMPWLPLYVDNADLQQLLSWLNSDEEIAFIVSDGPKRWKAVSSLDKFGRGCYCIWHLPSGPLPLLGLGTIKDSEVPDPWAGWTELRTGADPDTPYFGAGHPGIIWLNARPTACRNPKAIGLSSFEWIGNRYRVLGRPAAETTEKWWQRLRKSVKKVSHRIPRVGPCDGPLPEIWAFPSAHVAILSGVPRDSNP
jgi:hypothetical protein